MKPARGLVEHASQVEEMKRAVLIAEETQLAIVAAMSDVHRHTGQHESRASWHDTVNEHPGRRVDDNKRGLSLILVWCR